MKYGYTFEKPHTNIEITFAALNSYFLDTSDNTINEDYLNHLLNIHCFHSDRRLYDDMGNKRRKSTALAWQGLVGLTNELIKSQCLGNYYATGAQLKKWLTKYGRGYDSIAETVQDIEDYRNEEIFN